MAEAIGRPELKPFVRPDDKNARQPTDLEWQDALFDGMARKVANRIVPVEQETVAILPVDKELKDVVELAEHSRWGDVQEQAEKMQPLAGDKDAYRIYMIGLSHEAIASADASKLDEAADELNKASKNYDDAHKLKPNDREIFLAQIRVQDSLDHYLEVQHYLQSRKAVQETSKTLSEKPQEKPAENAADNAALIEMVKAGLDPSVVLTFVQTTPDPNFDTSGKGLLQMAQGKVPAAVIKAVQKRMAQRPGNEPANGTPPIRRSQPVPVSH